MAPKKKTQTRGTKSREVATLPAQASLVGNVITHEGGRKFTVKRQVTLPLLKQIDGQVVTIKITSAIYVGKQITDAKNPDKAKEKPADLVHVVELISGRPMVYIIGAVVKGNLQEQYPKDTYVGKCFAINKRPGPTGKRYKDYEILEIEDDGETE